MQPLPEAPLPRKAPAKQRAREFGNTPHSLPFPEQRSMTTTKYRLLSLISQAPESKETWLTGQTAQEAVGTMIAGGEYPDFIDGSDGQIQLYEAGALVALDDYLDKYPNIKEFYSDAEWDKGTSGRRKNLLDSPSSEISGEKT